MDVGEGERMDTVTKATVYELISLVSADMAKGGIAKGRKNVQQGYSFRGIDDVYNALAPMLAEHKLVILPRILSRECVERTARSGSAQFFVTVEAEFDFVAAKNPESRHTVRTFGEAQDSADKATNKAMSAAYKYAAFQTFCIPTEGDNDADATTPEATKPAKPEGYDDWLTALQDESVKGTIPLREAWKDSPEAFRKATSKSATDALKVAAEKADKAAA